MSSVSITTRTARFGSWFIVKNSLVIIFLVLAILFAIIFLMIVPLNKTRSIIAIMLASHSCIAEIIYSCNMLFADVLRSENHIKRRVFIDAFCALRSYLGYVGAILIFYSFT